MGLVLVSSARADDTAPPSTRDWHLGVNLRTDFATRYYRADVGVRFGRLDLIAVVDPIGVQHSDYDFDGIVRYELTPAWSVWSGARLTMVPVGRGHQYSEKLLFGVSGLMPSLGSDRIRLHSGLELAVHMHAHGADLMSSSVCIDSPACRADHFVFSLYGRLEFVSPF